MKTEEKQTELRFKTNINCSGCVARVSNTLNNAKEITFWQVDTLSKEKILTVRGSNISDQTIMPLVKSAGFNIEPI